MKSNDVTVMTDVKIYLSLNKMLVSKYLYTFIGQRKKQTAGKLPAKCFLAPN